jgi:hypothetical protein
MDKKYALKTNYMELKEHYKAMRGTIQEGEPGTRAQIEIYAGAYNRDRALYDKGAANWEATMKADFEAVEDGRPVCLMPMKIQPEHRLSAAYKKNTTLVDEEAVCSMGEYTKGKRNHCNTGIPAYLGKTWWK